MLHRLTGVLELDQNRWWRCIAAKRSAASKQRWAHRSQSQQSARSHLPVLSGHIVIFVVALLIMAALFCADQLLRKGSWGHRKWMLKENYAFVLIPLVTWAVVFPGDWLITRHFHRDCCSRLDAHARDTPAYDSHADSLARSPGEEHVLTLGMSLSAYTERFNRLSSSSELHVSLQPVIRRIAGDERAFTALLREDLQVTGTLSDHKLAQVVVLVSANDDNQAKVEQREAVIAGLLAAMSGEDEQDVADLVDQLTEEVERNERQGQLPAVSKQTLHRFELSLSSSDGYLHAYGLNMLDDDSSLR